MKRPSKSLFLLFGTTLAPGCVLPEAAPTRLQASALHDPAAILQAQMLDRWVSPERQTWRIDYRSISGLVGEESWHIEGTQYWVRLYPEVYSLEELDKESVYEIDAVALNQNYGVIDFYIYQFPEEIQE